MSSINTATDTTYTLQSLVMSKMVYSKSLFTASQLQPKKFQIHEAMPYQPDWILGVLISCIILITWARVFYFKRVQQIFKAPFSKRFINQLSRDGNLFKERVSVALGGAYILTFSLLLYEINQQLLRLTFPYVTGMALFGSIVAVVIVFQSVKVALIRLLGIVFKTRETTYGYLLIILIFTLFSGPILMVGLILLLYMKFVVILYICLILYILIFIFRLVRGFFIGISLRKFSYLFLFVYLCSLEILPLLIIIKLLLNHANSAGG